MSVAYVYGLSG